MASAGSAMHFLIAFVLALIAGPRLRAWPTNNYKVGSLEHWPGEARRRPQLAGLKAGDTIVSIDGKRSPAPTAMTDIIKHSAGKPLTLGVERDGQPASHLDGHAGERARASRSTGRRSANRGYLGVEHRRRPPRRSRRWPRRAQRLSAPCGSVTDQEVTGLGQTLLAQRPVAPSSTR